MATTTRGYPIFTGGMAPAGPTQMQQLAEAIDADVTATMHDTGWITTGITFLDGFGVGTPVNGFRSIAYRRIGKSVWVNGLIKRSTAWAVGAVPLILPVGVQPSRQTTSTEGYVGEDGRLYLYLSGLAGGQVNLAFSFVTV